MSIKEIIKFAAKVVGYYSQPIIKYVPRNKHKWAYGCLGGFRDNPKFFFYWTNENHPEIRAIWFAQSKAERDLIRSHGMESYMQYSLKGLYHALTAKVYVTSHTVANINHYFSAGAFYLNLWHGSSVKRVRWQAPEYFCRRYNLKSKEEMRTNFYFKMDAYCLMFRKPDLCLTPSTIQKYDFFAEMLDIPEDHCIVGVFPRSRLLIEGKSAALDFIKKYEPQETSDFLKKIEKYNKRYVYMPTWRNDGTDFVTKAKFDWEKLNSVLEKNNSIFILKLHPSTKMDLSFLSSYSNIYNYPSTTDIYTVLPFIDCLITDYSSIYTDFLTMNKEIILFVYDYEEYMKGSFKLSEYDKYFAGKRAYDFNQLLHIIESGEDCRVPQEKYKELMEFFWDNNRHKIDIVEEVKKRIGL
jgi:CDP-glycerol glycerophosphotransferase (TagB/SpsB family)